MTLQEVQTLSRPVQKWQTTTKRCLRFSVDIRIQISCASPSLCIGQTINCYFIYMALELPFYVWLRTKYCSICASRLHFQHIDVRFVYTAISMILKISSVCPHLSGFLASIIYGTFSFYDMLPDLHSNASSLECFLLKRIFLFLHISTTASFSQAIYPYFQYDQNGDFRLNYLYLKSSNGFLWSTFFCSPNYLICNWTLVQLQLSFPLDSCSRVALKFNH